MNGRQGGDPGSGGEKREVAWCPRWLVGLAVCCGLSLPVCAEQAAAQSARELLSQFVNIDRPDFQAKGKITLHRLQPLAGQLTLATAHGDPDWIFKTIAPWNPELSKVLREMKIRELTLTDSDLLLDGELVNLRLVKAAIPEGWMENVTLQKRQAGAWELESEGLRLERLPVRFTQMVLPLTGAIGFERMKASGTRTEGRGWAEGIFGQGWKAGRLEGEGGVTALDQQGQPRITEVKWKAERLLSPGLRGQAKRIPPLKEMLRFLGRDPDKQEPLALDQARMQLVAEGNGALVRIRELHLEAPWARIRGEGVLERQGGNGVERLRLDLIARRPDGQEKRFKATFPLSALVEP